MYKISIYISRKSLSNNWPKHQPDFFLSAVKRTGRLLDFWLRNLQTFWWSWKITMGMGMNIFSESALFKRTQLQCKRIFPTLPVLVYNVRSQLCSPFIGVQNGGRKLISRSFSSIFNPEKAWERRCNSGQSSIVSVVIDINTCLLLPEFPVCIMSSDIVI